MEEEQGDRYSLGIDLGTTSVKVIVINQTNNNIIYSGTQETKADIDVGDNKKSEQSVNEIFKSLQHLLQNIQTQVKQKVSYIGVSGQMHGVVMWRCEPHYWNDSGQFDIESGQTTNLVTWQDKRCDRSFLNSLPYTGTMDRLHSGFGLPTLIWLQTNHNKLFQHFTYSGTIQDLLVCILSGTTCKPTILDQNASSWGFYDTDSKQWKTNLLKQIEFPTEILPTVRSDIQAGQLIKTWSHIPSGCIVGGGAGDLETSVLSILHNKDPNCAIINISTSIQLTFLLPTDICLRQLDEYSRRIELRPYFENRVLAVGAGLNGGNFLAFIVSTLKAWLQKFGLEISQDKVWEVLLSEAFKTNSTDLKIEPTLLGERYCPEKTASINNIHLGNFNLGDLMVAASAGVINSLEELLPKEMLMKYGVKKIYTTGSALVRNKILQQEIQRRYSEFDIEVCDAGDAAFGAALMANYN